MNAGLSWNLPYHTPDQKRRDTADRKSVKSTAPSFLQRDTTISCQTKSQDHIWVNLCFLHSTVSYGIPSEPAFVITTDPTLPKTPTNYIFTKGGRGGEGEAAAASIFIDLRKWKFTLSNALVNANKIIATRCRGSGLGIDKHTEHQSLQVG